MMKNLIILILIFACHFTFAQSARNKECPPPVFKKGQTSAQVNADTRRYVDCVREFNKKQADRNQEKRRQQAAERERQHQRKLEDQRKRRNEEDQNRHNRERKSGDEPEVQG